VTSDVPKALLASSAAAVAMLVAACGPSIESNAVVDAPAVSEDHPVVFTDTRPQCEQQKIGDIRLRASKWPGARDEAEKAVRDMGGEAVVGWTEREVVVDAGGAGGSGVPGASSERARSEAFYFGIVVRFEGDCPEADV
jgi:hypothetical protein